MKKLCAAALCTTLIAVGCADTARDPLAVEVAGPAFIAQHGSINKPVVDGHASGSAAVIHWTWVDAEEPWDLVSFEVLRDGVELTAEVANAKPYATGVILEREVTDPGLADGTYEYCVEVMAKYYSQAQQATLTHHSRDCVTVQVGAPAYTIALIGGNTANLEQNANSANFTAGYYLMLGNAVVLDCTLLPAVTMMPGAVVPNKHNCDPLTGARNLLIGNPAQGTTGAYAVSFMLDNAVIGEFGFDAVLPGGGKNK